MKKVTKNHLTVTGLLLFCFIILFMALPAWAVVDSYVYVVWHDNTTDDGNYDIFFKKSLDGGETWEEPYENLSNNPGTSYYPSIAVNGDNLYVVWHDDSPEPENSDETPDIFFKKSTDGGNNWYATENISKNTSRSETWGIAITVDGSKLYVVWSDEGTLNRDIFFTKYDGDTWDDQPTNISDTPSDSYAMRASMAVDGDYIYVVWENVLLLDDDDIMRSFFRRSLNGGETWEESDPTDPAYPATYLGIGMCPVIAIDGRYLYVIRGGVWFRWSKDYGATWESDVALGSGMEPFIAVEGSNLYVVWEGNSPTDEGKEIYFRKGTLEDDVITWDPGLVDLATNISSNAGDSRFPIIAVDRLNVYVVWFDNSLEPNDGRDEPPYEIFYRRSTDGGDRWEESDPTDPAYPAKNLSDNTGNSKRPKVIAQYVPCSNSPVRIFGYGNYSMLQDAYDAALCGHTIQSQDTVFTEDLYIYRGKYITLQAGYNCDYDYTPNPGTTSLKGTMRISRGIFRIRYGTLRILE
jgi:hypothetical protein